MNSSEYRTCPVTGRTVVLAPQRADRPMTLCHTQPRGRDDGRPCPFCLGAEDETPPELFAIRDAAGWQLRVVPNKFPAVTADGPAFGHHEVLIECREHLADPTALTDAQFANIFAAYRDRLRHHFADPRVEAVSLFKNVGAEAGASLAHLHSQLVALPFVPAAGFSPSPLGEEGWGGGYEFAAAGDSLLPSARPTPTLTLPPKGGGDRSAPSAVPPTLSASSPRRRGSSPSARSPRGSPTSSGCCRRPTSRGSRRPTPWPNWRA